VKRKLLVLPTDPLQYIGLLIAFVLLVAASEYAVAHPAQTAILIFVFSLPYLAASLVAKRAHFLYATMLLGAVSYFLTCHALGAPVASFPVLSVPLVVCLWIVGYRLKRYLDAKWASYPTTVFRAMNITVGVFSVWALLQSPDLAAGQGWIRYVVALAFLGYAGLYLAHCLAGAASGYIYVFSFYLTVGGIFLAGTVAGVGFCWIPAIASAGVILVVGTGLHRDRKYAWSRHFYFCAAGAIAASLVLSLLQWPLILVALALASLLLWVAYEWLAEAIGDVRGATMAERVMAKCFFSGAMALSVPVAIAALVAGTNVHVALGALVGAVTFSSIFLRRRSQTTGAARVYALAAVLFASVALLSLGRLAAGGAAWPVTVWFLVAPVVLLAALGLAGKALAQTTSRTARAALAEAAVFPAFLAWYIPLLQGEWSVALAAAALVAVAGTILGAASRQKSYCYCLGPAIAGACISAALLWSDRGLPAWALCVAVAALAAGVFLWAGARRWAVARGAANLAWLALSVAAAALAATTGTAEFLYCATAVAGVAILLTARPARPPQRDIFDLFVLGLASVATVAAVAAGPLAHVGPLIAGTCLLILSAAYWLAWALGRCTGPARAACCLLALGAMVMIFGVFCTAGTRLGASAAVVAVLLALGAAAGRRFGRMADTAIITGHLTGIAAASAALVQAWSVSPQYLPLAAGSFVLLYALMPSLRKRTAFKVAALLWGSLAILLALAGYFQTPYRQHVPAVAFLSLIWLAVGYALARTGDKTWSAPLYISAAVVAVLCGILTLFIPAADAPWLVFLVNGIVFACLFLLLRQDVFIYLLTLSLSLLAYTWIKASTSLFTQDVLFYLVIAAALLGVFYALPYLRKLLGRFGTLPLFGIFTWQGKLLVAILVVGLGMLLLTAYSLKLTGHPKFCTTCHYMGDYYESWQHSSHKNVACIDCHYEPGVTSTMMGKIEGLVQVVKYVSHSYGAKPQAMISNSSCMREGCHAGMDHSNESLVFRGKIRFRHDKHLSEHPRGKELNCVSCHGQTVEGQHISVSETTCLTCHFYGRGEAPVAAGKCLTCHQRPEKAVVFMGQEFHHKKFQKARCSDCHSQVTQGNGAVSSTRCRSCHLRRTPEIKDQEQFHLIHVSEGHFDCLQCHDEIKHGIRPMEQQLLASGNCGTCHEGDRHSLQEKIYAGTALGTKKASPDPMYKAGVSCGGCHTDSQPSKTRGMSFTMKGSGAKQCTDCHNGKKRYGEMLEGWREDTKERIADLKPRLDKLKKAPADQLADVRELLDAADMKLTYVIDDRSNGAHNFDYISTMLDDAKKKIEKCEESLAKRLKKTPAKESGQ